MKFARGGDTKWIRKNLVGVSLFLVSLFQRIFFYLDKNFYK